MANIRIQGPLQFTGYTQTDAGGLDNQVLTYNGNVANWQSLPTAITPDQLPCFFTYFLNAIEVKVPATLFAVNGAIPANPGSDIQIVNGALPCRVFENGTYTNDNINLRT